MPVQVLEISGVPSPKPIVRGVGDFRSRLFRLFHRCIDFLSGFYDVADGELCWTRRADGYFCVLGQRGLWIQRQNEIVFHGEEDHGAVLEFRADDPLRRQTHSVAIKTQGSVQIADPQCDDFDPRSHILTRLLVADGAVSRLARFNVRHEPPRSKATRVPQAVRLRRSAPWCCWLAIFVTASTLYPVLSRSLE